MRSPKFERRLAKLQCNTCGYQFQGRAWYVAIQGEHGVIDWNIASGDAARGATCPNCSSDLIGAHRL